VTIWRLFFLLPQWCFALPLRGGATWHRETWIQLKCFLACNWENLQKEFLLQAQTLLASSSSIPFPNMIFRLTIACFVV
jgi:hypothetical protein